MPPRKRLPDPIRGPVVGKRFGHGYFLSLAKSIMLTNRLFGREREVALLDSVYASGSPEFVAIYGRRRIGKTYLIRECFEGRGAVYFEFTGHKGCRPQCTVERLPGNYRERVLFGKTDTAARFLEKCIQDRGGGAMAIGGVPYYLNQIDNVFRRAKISLPYAFPKAASIRPR
jgi:hypothetical protein